MIEPEEDGSNRTPAGLKVDKNGKFSIDEQRGMENEKWIAGCAAISGTGIRHRDI